MTTYIKFHLPKVIDLQTFASAYGLVLGLHTRNDKSLSKYYCYFDGVETKKNLRSAILTSTYGNGKTVIQAINDYLKQLEGLILVRNYYPTVECDFKFKKVTNKDLKKFYS